MSAILRAPDEQNDRESQKITHHDPVIIVSLAAHPSYVVPAPRERSFGAPVCIEAYVAEESVVWTSEPRESSGRMARRFFQLFHDQQDPGLSLASAAFELSSVRSATEIINHFAGTVIERKPAEAPRIDMKFGSSIELKQNKSRSRKQKRPDGHVTCEFVTQVLRPPTSCSENLILHPLDLQNHIGQSRSVHGWQACWNQGQKSQVSSEPVANAWGVYSNFTQYKYYLQ
ncbi:hypothetical protein C8R45DRAFT_1079979 [Mycena sanguinolenta]|nr:hypothetical protein C8R45DRAFT_1079979 [Mycena sanguinolenta]